MAIFRCKMCGGALEVQQEERVATCEYCGTCQTLPKLTDDRRNALYERANQFRRVNDFDKAEALYEQILSEDTTDSEAYWSLVLCRYGIEYVEDPRTKRRIPTVNRAQYTSVFDDANYRFALQYADAEQCAIYEEEARTINEIQKRILAISQKEEPFDVFICYKEKDDSGKRTPDSVLAMDLYHQLTREGYKVFFARVTLDSKLGEAYEPYIFAALHSAKVMVVLGTKPEYFQAVWVKNEWSRFLHLIGEGEEKSLIPAYKDFDPYNLPEEFSHLQALDMSKLGFMQDLVYGIGKMVKKEEPAPAAASYAPASAVTSGIEPLLKRAHIFLEDGDFDGVEEYCEKVLDLDPECGKAYFYKLLAELKLTEDEELLRCKVDFEQNTNYKKALRFGDASLASFLKDAANAVFENRRVDLYDEAAEEMEAAYDSATYLHARDLFRKLGVFRDSEVMAARCEQLAREVTLENAYQKAEKLFSSENEKDVWAAKSAFESLGGYRDAATRALLCDERVSALRAAEEKKVTDAIEEAFVFIRDKRFAEANEVLTRAKGKVSHHVNYYIARLLINYRCRDEAELAKQPVCGEAKDLSGNPYFQKIMELGDIATVERFRQIERKMQQVKAAWRPIGWLSGIGYLALSALPVLMRSYLNLELSFLPDLLLTCAPMLIYLLVTKLFAGANMYAPASYYMAFGFVSVVTDVIIMIVTGTGNLFFSYLGNKVIHAIIWFCGVVILPFENYGDDLNK
ncbi:MAG: TIR domain-containing protein [Clostridia bacterium]|nr:TIR domain-containing protein [Clostridia bacterium]